MRMQDKALAYQKLNIEGTLTANRKYTVCVLNVHVCNMIL